MSRKPNPTRKPNSNSRLKKLPDETQATIEAWCKDSGLEAVVARCASELSVVTNRSSLSEWLRWRSAVRELQEDFTQAQDAASAATELLKQVDPGASAEKLHAVGQLMFTQLALKAKDPEAFVALGKLELARRDLEARVNGFKAKYEQKERELDLANEKFRATLRTKLEEGLEALRVELSGNAKAEAAFRQLQEALKANS